MPGLSSADHTQTPPLLVIPHDYNAAYDLIERNLGGPRAAKTAVVDDAGSYSYRELARRVCQFANALRDAGMAPEQRVLLCLQDGIDFPVAFLGAILAGVVPVPVNTLLTATDYHYILSDSRAQIAFVCEPLGTLFEEIRKTVPSLRRIVVARHAASDAADSMQGFMADASPVMNVAATCRDDTCFWLYSSGSTGRPKGTIHVHSSLIQTAELYARAILGIQESDVVFSAAKLFFAYGLGNALTFPFSVGATAVLMAERALPSAVVRSLFEHRVTIFYGVPTLYAGLLAGTDLPRTDTPALRRCTSAGEPLPADIGRRWKAATGVDILDGIGSTEMLHIFLSNTPHDVRYGTTGKPVPGYSLRLVDDQGREVAPGEQGELHVAGPSHAAMYWNNRERNRSTFLGAWTRSGDKYSVTPDGYYVYAGRTDDMLKVGGIYVSPAEVEAALISHHAVLEVAVVARTDRDELVKPMAYVVVKQDIVATDELATALKHHVKALLAPYKYPRWVEFVDELPKTTTGKLLRYRLRELTAASKDHHG